MHTHLHSYSHTSTLRTDRAADCTNTSRRHASAVVATVHRGYASGPQAEEHRRVYPSRASLLSFQWAGQKVSGPLSSCDGAATVERTRQNFEPKSAMDRPDIAELMGFGRPRADSKPFQGEAWPSHMMLLAAPSASSTALAIVIADLWHRNGHACSRGMFLTWAYFITHSVWNVCIHGDAVL